MKNAGVMDQIREQLVQGKSSRELIDLGCRPGSVYGALRKLRHKDNATGRRRNKHGTKPATSVSELPNTEEEEDDWPMWHAEPALRCPGCGQDVVHWLVCPGSSRLMPTSCACPSGSPTWTSLYTLNEILQNQD